MTQKTELNHLIVKLKEVIKKNKQSKLNNAIIETEKFLSDHKDTLQQLPTTDLNELKRLYRKAVNKASDNIGRVSRQLFIELKEMTNLKTDHRAPKSHINVANFSNNVTWDSIHEVVTTDSIEQRILVLERLIKMMKRCFNKGDYATAAAISSALNHSSVSGLKYTFDGLSSNAKQIKDEIDELMKKRVLLVDYRDDSGITVPLDYYKKHLSFILEPLEALQDERMKIAQNQDSDVDELAKLDFHIQQVKKNAAKYIDEIKDIQDHLKHENKKKPSQTLYKKMTKPSTLNESDLYALSKKVELRDSDSYVLELCYMTKPGKIEKNKVYLYLSDNKLTYTAMNKNGEIEETIINDQIDLINRKKIHDVLSDPQKKKTLNKKDESIVFEITSRQGYAGKMSSSPNTLSRTLGLSIHSKSKVIVSHHVKELIRINSEMDRVNKIICNVFFEIKNYSTSQSDTAEGKRKKDLADDVIKLLDKIYKQASDAMGKGRPIESVDEMLEGINAKLRDPSINKHQHASAFKNLLGINTSLAGYLKQLKELLQIEKELAEQKSKIELEKNARLQTRKDERKSETVLDQSVSSNAMTMQQAVPHSEAILSESVKEESIANEVVLGFSAEIKEETRADFSTEAQDNETPAIDSENHVMQEKPESQVEPAALLTTTLMIERLGGNNKSDQNAEEVKTAKEDKSRRRMSDHIRTLSEIFEPRTVDDNGASHQRELNKGSSEQFLLFSDVKSRIAQFDPNNKDKSKIVVIETNPTQQADRKEETPVYNTPLGSRKVY